MEEWRDIPGYPGYQASSYGRVRSIDRTVLTAKGARSYRGKILRPGRGVDKGSRLSVVLGRANGTKEVHVLVAITFIGPNPGGLDVAHGNGRSSDNRAANLSYKTRADNNRDITRHGGRRLKPAQVAEIKTALQKPFRGLQRQLAARYRVKPCCISAINTGREYV